MKALVTVELQLCGDLFLSLGCSDRGKDEVDVLLCTSLVSNNTVVVEVANDRKIQYTLSCLDIRNICYPLLIGTLRMEISVEQIWVSVQIFSVIAVFPAPNLGKQIVFLHDAKHGLGILMYSLSFKPYMDSAVAIGTMTVLLAFSDLIGKRKIPCGRIHSFDIVIVAASRHLKEPAHLAN